MRKNIALTVLSVTLAVIVYQYVDLRHHNNISNKQLVEDNVGGSRRITLYESEDGVTYYIHSEDRQLLIIFTYGDEGIEKSFGMFDSLSGKSFAFNYQEGEMNSPCFFYEDKQYSIVTNVYSNYEARGKLIEREEWVNEMGRIYTLFSDGTTEIENLYYDERGIKQFE